MFIPLGANQAMKRRGGVQTAAPARHDHSAEGNKGNASVTPAPARNNLRDCRVSMAILSFACAYGLKVSALAQEGTAGIAMPPPSAPGVTQGRVAIAAVHDA
jgi:hypothetical protein